MIRRFVALFALVLALTGAAAPAFAHEDPLCIVQPQWCE